MELALDLVFFSIKALLLLAVAAGVSLALKKRPARLRAVVWGTAIVGTLVIPFASATLPALPVVVPIDMPRIEASSQPSPTMDAVHRAHLDQGVRSTTTVNHKLIESPVVEPWSFPEIEDTLVALWAMVALGLLLHQGASLWKMAAIIRRADPIRDEDVLEIVDDVRLELGCRSRIRLVASSEIDIPAVFGIIRPVVVLPISYVSWLEDRLTAVLQHELVHVVRLDWPVRIAARFARAFYWFNPVAWWAVRRLDLEQEMACDEEVLSLGFRASSYACHLLGIAHTAVHRPAFAVAGLEMARRSHLEERIMRILNRNQHRKVGLAVILPAVVLTAALVPAIAAVQPTEPGPREASPELKAAMMEMEQAEQRMEPYIERITEYEFELQPTIEQLRDIEVDIDHEAIARIEAEIEPILAQIEQIEIDMEPMHAQLEAMHESFEEMELHIEDGTLREIQEQIHAQMEEYHVQFESVHVDMEPFHQQMEALHAQLEPLHTQMAAIHRESLPSHEEIERMHAEMEPLHEEMERIHEEMEPFQEEMERAGARIEAALVTDVATVLRSHLGPVTGPGAPFTEAAARLMDEGNVHVHDDVLNVFVSRREAREILNDLFAPNRIGTEDAFSTALDAAIDEVSDLEIRID